MKNKWITISAAAVLTSAGVYALTSVDLVPKDCATVYVDFGVLDNGAKITKCVAVDGETGALDVLNDAGVFVEGTKKYGAQVACRVNTLPAADKGILGIKNHEGYIESCDEMPAEFAYWGVFVKRSGAASKWDWATTGISDVKLKSGDSIGLVFETNETVTIPE